MNRNPLRMTVRRASLLGAALAATAFALSLGAPAYAADAPAKKTATKSSAPKAAAQKAYPSPEGLFLALADAAKADDLDALRALLGPDGDALIDSGDAVADKQRRSNFAASYAGKHAVIKEGDAKAMLVVGTDDWPMPIPAVKGPGGWTLDTKAGAREILARRIGENELSAINVVRAIGDAERDYASEDRDVNKKQDYARRIISTPGKKDGLYWPTKEGEPPSPLGSLVAQASSEGYTGKKGAPTPYHGYYYRILAAQGKDAKGGARSYIVQGMMIGGFAVLAYPAQYGNSGVMSFLAGADGVVYQKDLGPNTAGVARAMKAYNPDSSWKPVN